MSSDASALRDRIVEMLKLKQLELANAPVTFSKILMKASTLNSTYQRIKKVYASLDVNDDGQLDDSELQVMVERLGIGDEVTATDLQGVIELCDIDGDRTISLKEFIVTLTLLYLLKAVPSLVTRVPKALKGVPAEGDGESPKAFLGASKDIHYLVHWVVAAYLIFDNECTGHINKSNVKAMQKANSKEDGSDLFLSEDRWSELDWDKNGQVSFEEFIFAFSEWIKDFYEE